MFSNNKRIPQTSSVSDTEMRVPTTIAEGITIKDGNLSGVSSVKISGTFFGNVEIEGILTVAGSGSLHGNVKAEAVYIYGAIEGNVFVKGKAQIYPAGSLLGDVTGASFVVEEGATFQGTTNIAATLRDSGEENAGKRNAAILEPIADFEAM